MHSGNFMIMCTFRQHSSKQQKPASQERVTEVSLSQKQLSGEWRPVAFISRSMTDTESRYVQIEKAGQVTGTGCVFVHQLDHGALPSVRAEAGADQGSTGHRWRLQMTEKHGANRLASNQKGCSTSTAAVLAVSPGPAGCRRTTDERRKTLSLFVVIDYYTLNWLTLPQPPQPTWQEC